MRRWFYGPFKDYLHKIVAGRQCTVGRHHPPDGAGVFSNSADAPASHLVKVPARPALQVFFCVLVHRVFNVKDTPYLVQRAISSSSSNAVSGCSASQFALS